MAETAADDFAEMAIRLHDEPTMVETVDRVLEYALKAVNCAYAGVIFVHQRKRVETAAATHPVVAELDALQMECGEGPDIDVLSDQFAVVVADMRTEQRWPTWAGRVSDLGIRSLLSVRLATGVEVVGTLNLYDGEPNKFDADDRAVAHIFARHAAVALASARNVEHLWQAIDARKLIGQAQGILMERYDLSADRAFAVLLRYSQDKNIKLREVANRLVTTRELPR
jgi:GAF domain-containing protein